MEISVNQTSYQLTEGCNVQQMLKVVLAQPASGLAIAINQQIIPSADWENYFLNHGDQIIIIKATQGG